MNYGHCNMSALEEQDDVALLGAPEDPSGSTERDPSHLQLSLGTKNDPLSFSGIVEGGGKFYLHTILKRFFSYVRILRE